MQFKPHLVFYFNQWICIGNFKTQINGYGSTPIEAYNNYILNNE